MRTAPGYKTAMRIRSRFLVGACVIAAAVGYLIVTAIRNTAEYYLTVEEVNSRRAELADQGLRVAGRVKSGSIRWDPQTLTLAFTITSIPNPDGDGAARAAPAPAAPATFHVVCRGQPKPDMFADNRDVIIEGRLASGDEINATQVLTSCPSKYIPKKGAATSSVKAATRPAS
jgi:cytochrome c-type biogenesis protein CcmE